MKEIQVKNKTYLFVEITNDAHDLGMETECEVSYRISSGEYKRINTSSLNFSFNVNGILGFIKDITEKQAESIVEKFEQKIGWRLDGDKSKLNSIVLFQNYNYEKPVPVTFLLSTAKESLQSLIQANGLDVNKNYLILQKLR